MKLLRGIMFALAPIGMLAVSTAQADTYGFAGCGAGTRIFGPRNMQTSAATTNHGTVGGFGTGNLPIPIPTSQVWSITFDIAGCDDSAMPVAYFDQYNYMFMNFASLAKEMSQGSGNTLNGLAAVFGCPETVTADFRQFVKDKFSEIYGQPGIRETFIELQSQLAANPIISAACNIDTASPSESVKVAVNSTSTQRGEK
jgi:hypothetical protein